MVKRFVVLALALGMCVGAVSSYAAEYDENAATKLARGLSNGVTCWIEVPKQIYFTAIERQDPLTALVYGSLKGVCLGVLRAVAGGYDTATFLIPPYDKPLLEPEFVFENWEVDDIEDEI